MSNGMGVAHRIMGAHEHGIMGAHGHGTMGAHDMGRHRIVEAHEYGIMGAHKLGEGMLGGSQDYRSTGSWGAQDHGST